MASFLTLKPTEHPRSRAPRMALVGPIALLAAAAWVFTKDGNEAGRPATSRLEAGGGPLGVRTWSGFSLADGTLGEGGRRWTSEPIDVPGGFNYVSAVWPTLDGAATEVETGPGTGKSRPGTRRIQAWVRRSVAGDSWGGWEAVTAVDDATTGSWRDAGVALEEETGAIAARLQLALDFPEAADSAAAADVVAGLELTTARTGGTMLAGAWPPALPPARYAGLEHGISKPPVVSRTAWGCPDGQDSRWTPVTSHDVGFLIVHHSAGSNSAGDWAAVVQSIWVFHTITRGWGDIGYNFVIDPRGVIYEGRAGGDNAIGAHFSCANRGTMGVCLLGNFESAAPTSAALRSLAHLLAWKAGREGLDPEGMGWHASSGLALETISGHRDANPATSPTACASGTVCPGRTLYAALPGVRDEVARLLADPSAGLVRLALESTGIDDAEWRGRGDGDGILEAGEAVGLTLTLRNDGIVAATGLAGTLTTTDPWVAVLDATNVYPDIPPEAFRDEIGDFDIAVDDDCPDGHVARLSLGIEGEGIEAVAIDVLLTVRGRPGDLALARWIEASFGPGTDPTITAPDADPDRDGLSNWLEFATGGDPLRVSPPVTRIARESLAEGGFAVLLRHRRPRDPEILAGIAHSWEWTMDPGASPWSPLGPLEPVGIEPDPQDPASEWVVGRWSPPPAARTSGLFRLRVEAR